MVHSLRGGLLAAATFLAAPAAVIAAPISPFYLTDGDLSTLIVIQGPSVTRFSATGFFQYPIAVITTIRTAATDSAFNGAEYTLGGVPTGTTFGSVPRAFDGTTDGRFNYTINFDTGDVIRTDLDWSNPVTLFTLPGGFGGYLGITFDASDATLWVSGWNTAVIEHYDLVGNLLSSFAAPTASMASLALDPADGTLWFGTQRDSGGTRTFYQYSRAGAPISTETYGSMANDNYLGGEFAFRAVAPVPAPAALLLFGVGILALAGVRRRV
jgi:hypothetical protein